MPGILLVDADAVASELAESLRRAGAEVEHLTQGSQALTRARANGPQAIILCAELPDSSGYTVCSKLKHDPALAGIPVVLTSAEATPETFSKHQKLQSRADHYLHKPLTADALLSLLAKHIQLKPSAPPTPAPRPATVSAATKTVAMPILAPPPSSPAPAPGSQSAPPDVAQDLLDISDLLTSLGQQDAAPPPPRVQPAAARAPSVSPSPSHPPPPAHAPASPSPQPPRPLPAPATAPLAVPASTPHSSHDAEVGLAALEKRVLALEERQQRLHGALQEMQEALRDLEVAQGRLRRALESAMRPADELPA